MKLSNKAVKEIKTNNSLQLKLALVLDCYQWTVKRLAINNFENNKLTTVEAIEAIAKETGFSQKEILTKSTNI